MNTFVVLDQTITLRDSNYSASIERPCPNPGCSGKIVIGVHRSLEVDSIDYLMQQDAVEEGNCNVCGIKAGLSRANKIDLLKVAKTELSKARKEREEGVKLS